MDASWTSHRRGLDATAFAWFLVIGDDSVMQSDYSEEPRPEPLGGPGWHRRRKLLLALVGRDIGSMSLLESFVCPRCRGGLAMAADAVRCDSCRLVYPVVGGVPVLLIDEARPSAPGKEVGLKPR